MWCISCMSPWVSSRENKKGAGVRTHSYVAELCLGPARGTLSRQRGVISGYLSQKGNSHLFLRKGENPIESPLLALN